MIMNLPDPCSRSKARVLSSSRNRSDRKQLKIKTKFSVKKRKINKTTLQSVNWSKKNKATINPEAGAEGKKPH